MNLETVRRYRPHVRRRGTALTRGGCGGPPRGDAGAGAAADEDEGTPPPAADPEAGAGPPAPEAPPEHARWRLDELSRRIDRLELGFWSASRKRKKPSWVSNKACAIWRAAKAGRVHSAYFLRMNAKELNVTEFAKLCRAARVSLSVLLKHFGSSCGLRKQQERAGILAAFLGIRYPGAIREQPTVCEQEGPTPMAGPQASKWVGKTRQNRGLQGRKWLRLQISPVRRRG